MIDVTQNSQFIAKIKVYDKHFEILLPTFQFLLFFLSNCNLFSSIRGPIQFLLFQKITYLLNFFFTSVLFVGQYAFSERLLSGQFLCFFFSSFRTIA